MREPTVQTRIGGGMNMGSVGMAVTRAMTLARATAATHATMLCVSILAAAWLASGCMPQKVDSYWATRPMRIDGQIADWDTVPLTYFKDSDVQLGLCNDNTNLYILFCTYDARWMQAIRRGGLTLWLDDSGKKKKIFGVRYVGGPPPSELEKSSLMSGGEWPGASPGGSRGGLSGGSPGGPSGGTPGVPRGHSLGGETGLSNEGQRFVSDQVSIIHKEKDKTTTLLARGPGGPAAKAGVSEDVYAYEFSIPLRSAVDHDSVFVMRPGETIYIGLELGGKGERQPGTQETAGYLGGDWGTGPEGSGFRGGSGGRGIHGGGPGGGHFGPLAKQKIWVTALLASSPAP